MSVEFEFEVKEVQKTTFKAKKDEAKPPIVIAHLVDEGNDVSIRVKEESESSFTVGEIWTLSKSEEAEK
jgi:hypothetical protein